MINIVTIIALKNILLSLEKRKTEERRAIFQAFLKDNCAKSK
jgi:hypothetical protein